MKNAGHIARHIFLVKTKPTFCDRTNTHARDKNGSARNRRRHDDNHAALHDNHSRNHVQDMPPRRN